MVIFQKFDYFRAFDKLIDFAYKGLTISYGELVDVASLPIYEPNELRYDLGWHLGNISRATFAQANCMLSSIVISKERIVKYKSELPLPLPGQGYFDLAEELFDRTFNNEKQKMDFWREQMEAVRRYAVKAIKDKKAYFREISAMMLDRQAGI